MKIVAALKTSDVSSIFFVALIVLVIAFIITFGGIVWRKILSPKNRLR